MDFHLDDDPFEIYHFQKMAGGQIEMGTRVFTNWQAKQLNKRIDQLYQIDWDNNGGCPIGYMLDYQWIKGKLHESR